MGKIVSKKSSLSGPTYPWPMGITAGDISRNGRLILIRNYPGKHNISYHKYQTIFILAFGIFYIEIFTIFYISFENVGEDGQSVSGRCYSQQ